MKKSKFLIAGMAALALSFGSVLAGCDNGTPSDGDPQTISISEVQLYTTTGNAYPGSGTVQTVTGTVFQSFSVPVGGSPAEQEPEYNFHDGSGQGHSIGTIGSISADGKLTLTLGELSDADLFDAGMDGVKYGMLVTSPGLLFAKSHEDDLVLVYINKDYTIDGQSVKKGWDFGGNTDTSGYKWVIDTAAKNGTPNVINGYWGVTNDGKNIEIVVTPSVSSSVARAANWSTGDSYVAKVDGIVVSRGTIVASGGSISFTSTDGSSVNITGNGIVINSSAGTTYNGTIVPARDYFYCIGASTDYTQSQIASSFSGKTPEQVYNYCSTTGYSHFDWPETEEGTWEEIKAFGKEYSCPNGVIADIGNTLNANGNVSAWGYYRHPDGYNIMFYIAKVPIVNNY